MNKKLFIILIAIIIIGLIIGGYFYWQSKQKEKAELLAEGLISTKIMQSAVLSSDKKWVNFYSSEGVPAFYRLEIGTGKIEQISEELQDIEEINFSPNLTKVGFKVTYDKERFQKYGSPFANPAMNDGENKFWIYDFEGRKLSDLSKNITQYVFSQDSKKIFYIYLADDGQESMNQMAVDVSGYKKIIDLKAQFLNFLPLNDQQLILAITSDANTGNGLYLLNIETKKNDLLTNSNFSSLMSIYPSKEKILFDNLTAENNKLSSIIFSTDAKGKNRVEVLKGENLEFDFNHLVWNKDEKSCFFAGREIDQEKYGKLFRLDPENKKLTTIIEKTDANSQAVGIDETGTRLFYLLNSQLYALKI